MLALICFAVVLVLIVSLFKRGTDIFSPARLFSIIWMLSIGLAELKFSRFQYEWPLYSWLMLSIAFGGTLIGMYSIYVIRFNTGIKPIKEFKNDVNKLVINEILLFKVIVIFFVVYFISYLVSYLSVGYVPLFTKHPGATRSSWGVFGLGLVVQAVPSLLYLIAIYFFYIKGNTIKKLLLALFFFISFLLYAFLLQRYYLILFVVLLFVLWYYRTKKIKVWIIVALLLSSAAIIYLMSSVRVAKTLTGILFYISEMRFSREYSLFTEPYMYIVMNLENFASGVNTLTSYTYGYYSFDFILALTGLKHSIAEYASIGDFPGMITSSYNTYTMYFVYYRDFG